VIHEGFDIALRLDFLPLEESDLVVKVLARYAHRLVASPTLFDRFARPVAPADLRALPSITARMLSTPAENGRKGGQPAMHTPPVVSPQAWEAAREQLLVKEKAQTRARDALAAERRRMRLPCAPRWRSQQG
jgi:DNA-binding transcriptional LysR family regulator